MFNVRISLLISISAFSFLLCYLGLPELAPPKLTPLRFLACQRLILIGCLCAPAALSYVQT